MFRPDPSLAPCTRARGLKPPAGCASRASELVLGRVHGTLSRCQDLGSKQIDDRDRHTGLENHCLDDAAQQVLGELGLTSSNPRANLPRLIRADGRCFDTR